MSISFLSAEITKTIVAVDRSRIPCSAEHPYFQKHSIENVKGYTLREGCVGDVDCTNQYVRAMRDGHGVIHNVAISKLDDSGFLQQTFIPGARQHGLFARYGFFSDRIILTTEESTAAVIYGSTGETTVAALHASNLHAVCMEIRAHQPQAEVIIAVDFQAGLTSQDDPILLHATELAAKYDLRLAISGDFGSFAALLRVQGHDAIRKQLDYAEVPTGGNKSRVIYTMPGVLNLPSSQAQNGSSLMYDLQAAIQRHMVLPDYIATLIALWVIYTHLYHHFEIAPYLAITSPEKRCGKTSLLTFLDRLCRNSFATSNTTEAAIFRTIAQGPCTLLIDEADTYLGPKGSMIGILNSGYKLQTGYVTRCGKNGVEHIPTFCPKAIAMIGEMPETLKDRSIQVRLDRKSHDEKVQPIAGKGPDEISMLRARLLRWVSDNEDAVADVNPSDLDLGNDRAEDNAKPLLAVASVIGGAWLDRARKAFEEHSNANDKEPSNGERLLEDIARLFEMYPRDRYLTKEILGFLHQQEEAPWPKYKNAQKLGARDLASMLNPFGICSTQMRYGSGQVGRGYVREHFTKAFARYVKPKSAL